MIKLSKKDFDRLSRIVTEETGNHVQEKNYPMLESRLRAHISKLQIEDMEQYWAFFDSNEEIERESLKSLMTTHYTFFFREFIHFEQLGRWIDSELPRLKQRFAATGTPVKIWSAACSRGQEVYSLAMFLENHLLGKHGIPYSVLGTDIDKESVNYARNGVYPIAEANTIPNDYLTKYWLRGKAEVKDFAAVNKDLRKYLQFDTVNLLEIPQWANRDTFDIIFCRNVFIYFTEQNVQKIATDLKGRLNPGGLLVSGLSEPLRFSGFNLNSVGPSCYQLGLTTNSAPQKPQKPADVIPIQKNVTPAPVAANSGSSYYVLCVDDSPTIHILMKKIFSRDPNCAGIDTAMNGQIARTMLDRKKYDVITLDIHMPEVTGIEFLERLYQRKTDPPVIMVSSVNRKDVDLATKALSLGAFDYVEKPEMNKLAKSAEEILAKVNMAIRSKDQEKAPVSNYDLQISQKIVVPDASLCLRWVMTGKDSESSLISLIKSQSAEYRSPATVIAWSGEIAPGLESTILKATNKTVVTLRDPKAFLRPNTIYIADDQIAEIALKHIKANSVSLQILSRSAFGTKFPQGKAIQVLLDEPLLEKQKTIELSIGHKVTDVTPSTSFTSLSLEFFANLRKLAA